MSKHRKNLTSIIAEVCLSAPSEKAADFAEKIGRKVYEHNDDWLKKNATALAITHNAEQMEKIAPVKDNRIFYLTQWQLVLAEEGK